MGHPLNGAPLDIRREFVKEIARQEKANFDEILPRLIDLISRVDPLHSVALMSMYGLMVTLNERESKRNRTSAEVQQGHVEFLQAIALRNRLNKDMPFPEPASIQSFFDWLPQLFSAYQQMGAGASRVSTDITSGVNDANVALVQAFLRSHTSVVRNWGYFGSVTRISRNLFSRIDDDYELLAGMKLTKVVDVFEWLIRRHEDKVNIHRKKLHSVFHHKTVPKMLEVFFGTFKFSGDVDVYCSGLYQPGTTKQHVMSALMHLADRHFAAECIGFVAQSRLPGLVASGHDRTQGRQDALQDHQLGCVQRRAQSPRVVDDLAGQRHAVVCAGQWQARTPAGFL